MSKILPTTGASERSLHSCLKSQLSNLKPLHLLQMWGGIMLIVHWFLNLKLHWYISSMSVGTWAGWGGNWTATRWLNELAMGETLSGLLPVQPPQHKFQKTYYYQCTGLPVYVFVSKRSAQTTKSKDFNISASWNNPEINSFLIGCQVSHINQWNWSHRKLIVKEKY